MTETETEYYRLVSGEMSQARGTDLLAASCRLVVAHVHTLLSRYFSQPFLLVGLLHASLVTF